MTAQKILSLKKLKEILKRARKCGKKIVFTNGCFDILHFGHIQYLEKAKQRGEILVIGLNSDASVKRLKGPGRPIVPEKDRSGVLAALSCVDYVVVFKEETPYRLIQALQPDILAKGGDWKPELIVGADIVKKRGGDVISIPYLKNKSTSGIIEKIITCYAKKC